ncbi:sensor histidine kinase [Kibdelosporangium aridum]|uniref:Signal transduction histidine-protein kinase/phosphatase MprB n=1 Tax=Kibdelosporangium aridum TaxID=2030 RepID=A0A428ZN01_KIBAR|nr:HAMP domain-containing sensor histidine kinase [Kibdelosporangium aridum]RSM89428.1 sensor histidine kinase [Kibdelosporangium aridum]
MRKRIVMLVTMAAVVATTLFGVPLGVFVARYYWDDERTELERVATAAALAVANDLSGSPQLPVVPADTTIGLYTPTGELRAGSGPALADRAVQRASNGEIEETDAKDSIVVAIPIMDEGRLLGVMRAMKSHKSATIRTAFTLLTMLGSAVFAVAVTWLLARRMAARLARPLEDLSATAKVLGEGDFTVRTGHSGVPEIDSVGTTLNTTAQRIGETLDRERAFSANASHQLRTPIAGLRLQLEGALESPDDPRPAIGKSIAAVDRLERTVNDLLTLARDVNSTPVADLGALLDDVESTWREPLASVGRSLEIDVHGAPAPRAAEAGVRQILNVLVDNAYTHGSGTVRVCARDAGGALAVDVSDEGAGIRPGVDVFAKRTNVHNGHGIGLALARSLAEADGGRLMHSDGSTFTLLLPSATESADRLP